MTQEELMRLPKDGRKWELVNVEAQHVIVYFSPLETQTYEADDGINAGDLLLGSHCRVSELFALE